MHLHLSRAQYEDVTSYVTSQLQYIAAFGGLQAKLQQIKVVVCCLDGEILVGIRKDPFLRRIATNWKCTTKLPSQLFRCTAFDCLSISAGCLL